MNKYALRDLVGMLVCWTLCAYAAHAGLIDLKNFQMKLPSTITPLAASEEISVTPVIATLGKSEGSCADDEAGFWADPVEPTAVDEIVSSLDPVEAAITICENEIEPMIENAPVDTDMNGWPELELTIDETGPSFELPAEFTYGLTARASY